MATPPLQSPARPVLDVIIPARAEGAGLGGGLAALLAQAAGLDLRIVVAVNGEDAALTCAVAEPYRAPFAESGAELLLERTDRAGKANALNLADRHRREGAPVVYLDADVVLRPGSLAALALALQAPEPPRLRAPAFEVALPDQPLERSFAQVWSRLPSVSADVIGAGCYGVNAAGRRRWQAFPDLAADDLFVTSRFAPDEKAHCEGAGFVFTLPDEGRLLATLRRWTRANRALTAFQRSAAAPARASRNLGFLLRTPSLWPHLPAFAWFALARRGAGQGAADSAWTPPRCAAAPPPQPRASLRVVIVTYNSARQVEDCLRSLRSRWADLDVVVVDNGSSDDTCERVTAAAPRARLFRNAANRGFAAAVNQAAAGATADLLLVNPDVVLDPNTIDELVAARLKFPAAGLYGGAMRDTQGRDDPTSCLPLPSLWQALAFALGLATLPGLWRLDPESLGGWPRRGVRSPPALSGGLLLIDGALWRDLGGFEERYFLYGEDVDFCLRARRRGARPLFTSHAAYTHLGGASSAGPADRLVLILRGKAQLLRDHLPRPAGDLAVGLLRLGVGARALAETGLGKPGKWSAASKSQNLWRRGWNQILA